MAVVVGVGCITLYSRNGVPPIYGRGRGDPFHGRGGGYPPFTVRGVPAFCGRGGGDPPLTVGGAAEGGTPPFQGQIQATRANGSVSHSKTDVKSYLLF